VRGSRAFAVPCSIGTIPSQPYRPGQAVPSAPIQFFQCTIAVAPPSESTLSVRCKLSKGGVCTDGPLPVPVVSIRALESVAA
jgi:hypothetical protein